LRDKVHETFITDLDLSTTPLTNGCLNDYIFTPAVCDTAWLSPFSVGSVMSVL